MSSPQRSPSVRWIVGKNTTSQIIGKGIGAGITLIITVLIANRFGTAGYGDFTKITTYIAFFYLVADFGLNAVFLHDSEGASPQENHFLWHALVSARLFLSTFLILASLLIVAIIPKGTTQGYTDFVKLGILLFSPTIAFQAILTSANAIFQKNLRYDLSTIATSAGSVASLVLVWMAADASKSVLPVVASLLIGSMITAAVAIFFAMRLHKTWGGLTFDTVRIKHLLIASSPLAATLLFNLVYFRVDSVILTLSRTTTEVGIYGFAYKFFEFPLVIPTFFMNSLYPLFLSAKRQSAENFLLLVNKSAVILFAASLIFLATFWLAAPLITFIKPEFGPSVAVVRILVTGLPFFFLSSLTMWGLITLKKQKVLAVVYFFAMIVNVLLNALLIPAFGYVAAAWITVFSEGFVLVFSGLLLVQYLHQEKTT